MSDARERDAERQIGLANVEGRATILRRGRGVDIADLSEGRWGPDARSILDDWAAYSSWLADLPSLPPGEPVDAARLGPPVPEPRQVFAIGLNYAAHAAEAGFDATGMPQVFTKFPSCLSGPVGSVPAHSPRLDWEVELVAVVGARAEHVAVGDGWNFVAGLMVGQDLSARDVQLAGNAPQWSLGKSFPGFGPTGPAMVPIEHVPNRHDLRIECLLNGEVVQSARTSHQIWSVPHPGDELVSRIEALGELHTSIVAEDRGNT
jgi:2-keto-4-pentenoate hydratase/2-oxohepta-3-ene-1,7-dioic acid hydratase in catechol pathway